MKPTPLFDRNGFTLMEFLLVATIIAIVSALAIGIGFSLNASMKTRTTKSRMETIVQKAKQYFRTHGELPDPINANLVTAGPDYNEAPLDESGNKYKVNRGNVANDDLKLEPKYRTDAWGQYFGYVVYAYPTITGDIRIPQNGRKGRIRSAGPDQTMDTPDDITLWINVTQEATEISVEELKVLQAKAKAFDALYEGVDNDNAAGVDQSAGGVDGCVHAIQNPALPLSCPPLSNLTNDPNCGTATLDLIELSYLQGITSPYNCSLYYYGSIFSSPVGAGDVLRKFYSLATGLSGDSWGHRYMWGLATSGAYGFAPSDPRYHKFYSQGPDGVSGTSDDIIP